LREAPVDLTVRTVEIRGLPEPPTLPEPQEGRTIGDFVGKALYDKGPHTITKRERAVAEAKRAAETRAARRAESIRKAEEAYMEKEVAR
jgi:hypothetical protein